MTDFDYEAHFRRYADAYTRSLGDKVEAEEIGGFFAADFLALSLDGKVINAGKNDKSFAETLEQSYQFYKAIGTKAMQLNRVEVEAIADNHDRVRVFYTARYARGEAGEIQIPFDVTYLLQRQPGGPKIFAFIAGDEMGEYRRHGLVDEDGKPV